MDLKKHQMINNQKGFTLIEIIAVLVILGILAVVAVPKFVDLQTQAAEKSADGVWGAANSVASMNFAKGVLDPTNSTPISTGAHLLSGMDSTPDGWTASGTTITKSPYVITITAIEVEGVSRAVLAKTAGW